MSSSLKLYMFLLGCKPAGRHTEQHDLFFSIGASIKEVLPHIRAFWPEAADGIHIDAWREVTLVDDYQVTVQAIADSTAENKSDAPKLFFLNLGGYKADEFEEYHYKVLTIANDKNSAINVAQKTVFFKHIASPHVDDKYGVDVDDLYEVEDILPQSIKSNYRLLITPGAEGKEPDEVHLGYFKLNSF